MLLQLLSPLHRTLQITSLLGLASLAAFSSAQAVVNVTPANVVPSDTFSINMIGYNTSAPSDNTGLLFSPLTPTFGTTQNFPGYALANQTVTVTSSEFATAGNTITDFITVSVPTNFVPAGTVDNSGRTINAIAFSIGITNVGGTNPLDMSTALNSYNATGTITFKVNGATTAGAVPLNTTLTNGNKSFSSYGIVTATPSTASVSDSQPTAFSFNLTYAAVPEPSTTTAVVLGLAGLAGMIVMRNRRGARA